MSAVTIKHQIKQYIEDIQIFWMNMLFISSSEVKKHISWVTKQRMKYTFSRFTRKINGIFIQKIWIFFISYTILSVTDFLYNIASCRKALYDVMTKSENFSKSQQFYNQTFPCNLIKKMNNHSLCFCPLIRKLQPFENLKWVQGSQWRKQRASNFILEIQLIFAHPWNTAFYIFTAMKIKTTFSNIYHINQYFPVFHYFVYNKSMCLLQKD